MDNVGALSYSMPAFMSIIDSAAMYSRLKVFAFVINRPNYKGI